MPAGRAWKRGIMAKAITGVKKRAWSRFSELRRVECCIETTKVPFVGVCVTCDKRFYITYLQAGHCFPGHKNGRLFQHELVNAQCVYDNETLHGRAKEYRRRMEEKYSVEQVAQWEVEGNQVIHDRDMDFEDRAKIYKERTLELLAPFGYHSYEELIHGKHGF